MKMRAILISMILVGAAAGSGQAQAIRQREPDLLTNVASIRALTVDQASRHLTARLRGVVLGEAEPKGPGFALQDETGGIYVHGLPQQAASVHLGDVVAVDGKTDQGEFAPILELASVEPLGKGEIPRPQSVTFDQLTYGNMDAQWVEIAGIVRACVPDPDGMKCRLELSTGNGILTVRWNVREPPEPVVDAEVRLRGVCYYQFNKDRQALAPLLAISEATPVLIDKPAPLDPFAAPLQPASSLFRFSPKGNFGHRVRVRGVVAFQDRGKALWIQGQDGGLRVLTDQDSPLALGDVVDVLGFPAHGPNGPILEDAIFRQVGMGSSPSPTRLASADDAFDHDGMVVQLDTTLQSSFQTADGWALMLGDGSNSFRALLPLAKLRALPPAWDSGSKVRITGISSALRNDEKPETGLWRSDSLQILMRSPGDLEVLAPPPWWTRRRVTWLLAVTATFLVAALGATMLVARWRLNQEAARRAMSERELSAILSERNRMAREIHDTLAQGLGAISMQMELAKSDLQNAAPEASKHLELAHKMVRTSLTEVRHAIWNMRSQALEEADLATALDGILTQMTNNSVAANLAVIGKARRLPPMMENAVLRIGQEAITNAAKHAAAGHINVTLEFDASEFRLRVNDDGRGFDPARGETGNGRFGLLGMRERAAQIHGELDVQSEPGGGTALTLTAPIAAAEANGG